jgi:hypothetical protein
MTPCHGYAFVYIYKYIYIYIYVCVWTQLGAPSPPTLSFIHILLFAPSQSREYVPKSKEDIKEIARQRIEARRVRAQEEREAEKAKEARRKRRTRYIYCTCVYMCGYVYVCVYVCALLMRICIYLSMSTLSTHILNTPGQTHTHTHIYIFIYTHTHT